MMKTIKLTLTLLLTVLVISLAGCKKEIAREDSTPIVGKWAIRSYVITNFENRGKDIDDTQGQFPRPTFEFDNNGVFTSTLETHYTQVIGFTISADKIMFSEKIAFDHKDFTFNISGSVLTLKRTQTYKATNTSYAENTTITLDKL